MIWGPRQIFLSLIAAAAFWLAWQSFYVVQQTERAVLLLLGELVQSDIKPGLGFKIPLIHDLRRFEGRAQAIDLKPQIYLTKDKEVLEVDSYLLWRVKDAGQFYRATGGQQALLVNLMAARADDALRNQFGEQGKWGIVSSTRDEILDRLTSHLNRLLEEELGVTLLDVRIKRIELPSDASESVYRRMRAERQRLANEARAEGREISERIRAEAERVRTETLATAYQAAETLRGEGDATAAEIYASAYNKDVAFFTFVRSLESYRKAFANKGDVLLLSPESEFFRFFQQADGSEN